MRNRAKCKKCGDVLESFHRHDYVTCSCGQISIDGGQDCFRANAFDWTNFLRLDDQDREIPVKVVDKENVEKEEMPQESLEPWQIFDELIKQYEHLPQHAMLQPATNADVLSLLYIFKNLLKELRRGVP